MLVRKEGGGGGGGGGRGRNTTGTKGWRLRERGREVND